MKLRYRAVFISDAHLGSRGSQARDLARFLRCIECRTLYLVGDVIDIWRMRGRTYWPVEHNEVILQILNHVRQGVEVRFIPGNHDDALRAYADITVGGVHLRVQDVHETLRGERFLVTHGDEFDLVVRHSRLLSQLGGAAYEALIVLNRFSNRLRTLFGRESWSLAQYVKLRVKRACMYVSQFEHALTNEARRRRLDGVICGHIHKPEATTMNGVKYFNCGDWIENCTAVVEHLDGSMGVVEALPAIAQMVREQRRDPHAAANP